MSDLPSSERDAALLALRPSIAADPALASSPVEAFQHRTLRPALKLQNDVLVALAAAHVRAHVKGFDGFDPADRRARLEAVVRADSKLKRTLVGVVVGVFTAGEVAFWLAHEAELRRRTVALLARRLSDQADTLVG